MARAIYTRVDPHHLAVFSPVVRRTMLRDRMRFGGVIVSDDLGAAQAVATVPPGSRAIQFIWTREALLAPLEPGSLVVALSSGAAVRGSPLSGGYAGAKATIRFLTGYAAAESERDGSAPGSRRCCRS